MSLFDLMKNTISEIREDFVKGDPKVPEYALLDFVIMLFGSAILALGISKNSVLLITTGICLLASPLTLPVAISSLIIITYILSYVIIFPIYFLIEFIKFVEHKLKRRSN